MLKLCVNAICASMCKLLILDPKRYKKEVGEIQSKLYKKGVGEIQSSLSAPCPVGRLLLVKIFVCFNMYFCWGLLSHDLTM